MPNQPRSGGPRRDDDQPRSNRPTNSGGSRGGSSGGSRGGSGSTGGGGSGAGREHRWQRRISRRPLDRVRLLQNQRRRIPWIRLRQQWWRIPRRLRL